MDQYKNLNVDEKIKQMKEDYNSEWWRPSKIDNFDIKNKVTAFFIKSKFSKISFIASQSRMQTFKKKIFEM
jgi:hypothetical protein